MTIPDGAIARLIELARWAPSGDNTQPWRFERLAADHLVIHGFDTRDHCVYDLDGHSSQIAIGAMIETMHIAATEQSLLLDVTRCPQAPEAKPTFDVLLRHQAGLRPDQLLGGIPRRSVNRRPYSSRPITAAEQQRLQASLPAGYSLRWHSKRAERWRMACLMFANAKLRLTMREAFEVHRSIIDWGQRYSADRVPDQALGVDTITLKLMRWAMVDWNRITFMNRWLGGTLAPRIQMDLLPSLRCAAHVAIAAERSPSMIDDYVNAGRAVQRFWLTATLLGLEHQPEMTPLIFARYHRQGLRYSEYSANLELGSRLASLLESCAGEEESTYVWLGRIGQARHMQSRSLRLSAEELSGNPP